MVEETQPDDTQLEGDDVTPAGGSDGGSEAAGAVEETKSAADVSKLSLDELNKVLGKDFKSKDDALNSIKEANTTLSKTQNELYQLKQKQSQGDSSNDDRISKLESSLHNSEFYSEHPEYKPYKNVIASLGQNPEEVIASEEKKGVLDKLIAHDEAQKSKSVLMSNPRLGQVTDKISSAKEKINSETPDFAGAETDAVNAVVDAYMPEK